LSEDRSDLSVEVREPSNLSPEDVRAAIDLLVPFGYVPDASDVEMLNGWAFDPVVVVRLLAEFLRARAEGFKDAQAGRDRLWAWLKTRERGQPLPTPPVRPKVTPEVAKAFPPVRMPTMQEQLRLKHLKRQDDLFRMGFPDKTELSAEERAEYEALARAIAAYDAQERASRRPY
jgi:hypothetical protein